MIRCNNCMRMFKDESELTKILDILEQNTDGTWNTIGRTIYEGTPLNITDTHQEEVFEGCGECMTDEYLMDIEETSTQKAVQILAIMEVLLQLIGGGEFESKEDYLEFRLNVTNAGYSPAMLDDKSPLEVFQFFCKEFSVVDLDTLKEGVSNVVFNKKVE